MQYEIKGAKPPRPLEESPAIRRPVIRIVCAQIHGDSEPLPDHVRMGFG